MVRALPPTEFLALDQVVVDVRSPREYAQGHLPGAVSLPMFTDEERAVVGTLYKQQGRDAAVREGLRLVGPKMAGFVDEARSLAGAGPLRVYCWRGGERSGSMAWLFDKAGIGGVSTLRGGYKAFRRTVLDAFPGAQRLHVLGGSTGSGKTATLGLLRARGAQVVDLEALAHHKGSSFGAIGEAPQPTTEHFENLLWDALRRLDPGRPVWVEDESMMIGRIKLPDAFYAAMRTAPLWFVEMPLEQRVARLVEDYGRHPRQLLAEAIERIRKRLGPQHAKSALEALEAGDLATVARITLHYYDRAYERGVSGRDPARVHRLAADAGALDDLAARLMRTHDT